MVSILVPSRICDFPTFLEHTLSRWLKKPGDRVECDEPLYEIHTDIFDCEVPAVATGVLAKILVKEGSIVQLGSVVGEIRERYRLFAGRKIFIGHGHSMVWRILKDFLEDDLGLEWDEFNRQSVAGISIQARLEHLLADCCFAFLIMTGEDERLDGMHARDNVVHEVGLFQGKLGFNRAIILLEEGCTRFSNIDGLNYIAFPKGHIEAAFEAVRRVLKRENIPGEPTQIRDSEEDD